MLHCGFVIFVLVYVFRSTELDEGAWWFFPLWILLALQFVGVACFDTRSVQVGLCLVYVNRMECLCFLVSFKLVVQLSWPCRITFVMTSISSPCSPGLSHVGISPYLQPLGCFYKGSTQKSNDAHRPCSSRLETAMEPCRGRSLWLMQHVVLGWSDIPSRPWYPTRR